MSSIEVILKATDILTTLSVTDIRALLPYQRRLEDALQALHRNVEAVRAIQPEPERSDSTAMISSSAPSVSDPASPHHPAPDAGQERTGGASPTSFPSSTGVNASSDGCNHQLSGALNLCLHLDNEKRAKRIRDYLSSSDHDPLSGMHDWTKEDPRVIDLRLGSSPSPSFDVKFRRGLSQRSLATEFNQWEKANFQSSRVLELSQNPATSDDRSGHIDGFLQANALRFQDKSTTRNGIKHGIRLLVFESIYGHVGVSAILMLVYTAFRSVKYREYSIMKEYLEKWKSLARGKSSWLTQCQENYDGKSPYTMGELLSDSHPR